MANETLYEGIDRSISEIKALLAQIDVDVKDKDVAKAQEAAKKAVSNYAVETDAETELSEDIKASGSAKLTPVGRAAEGNVGLSGKEGETSYGLGAGGGVDLHADEGKGLGLKSSASVNLAGFSFSISNLQQCQKTK